MEYPSDAEAYFPDEDVYEFNADEEDFNFDSTQHDDVPDDKNEDELEYEIVPIKKPAQAAKSSQRNEVPIVDKSKNTVFYNFDTTSETNHLDSNVYKMVDEIDPQEEAMYSDSPAKPQYRQEPMSFSNMPQYMDYANRQTDNADGYQNRGYENQYASHSGYGNWKGDDRAAESSHGYNYAMNQDYDSKQFSNRTPPVGYGRQPSANNFTGYPGRPMPPDPRSYNYMNYQSQYPAYGNSGSMESESNPQTNRPMSYSNRSTPIMYQNESAPSYNQHPSYNSIDFSTEPTYMGYSNVYGSNQGRYNQDYGQATAYPRPFAGTASYPQSEPMYSPSGPRFNPPSAMYNHSHHSPTPGSSYNHTPSPPNYNQPSSSYGLPYSRPAPPYTQSGHSNYQNIPTNTAYTNQPSPSYVSRPNLNPFPNLQQIPNYSNFPLTMQYNKPQAEPYDTLKNMISSNYAKITKNFNAPFFNNYSQKQDFSEKPTYL